MNYWQDGHMSNGWGIVMVFSMLGLWLLIALVVTWLIRSSGTSGVTPTGPNSMDTRRPEHILAERLASGDIEPEEYWERLSALSTTG